MLKATKPRSSQAKTFKNVQNLVKNVQQLPERTMLADVIQSLESSLREKGLLPQPQQQNFFPLWFLVETERNIFLWRNGFSLIQQDEFEFWIDLPGLVEKRLQQLDGFQSDNPFLNPLWDSHQGDSASTKDEREYLEAFIELTKTMEGHLHALSRVGSTVMQECVDEERQMVVLP